MSAEDTKPEATTEKPEQKTLKDLTVEGLKALAYDQLAAIEQAQNALRVINAELASRKSP